jgi:hypothetical protein
MINLIKPIKNLESSAQRTRSQGLARFGNPPKGLRPFVGLQLSLYGVEGALSIPGGPGPIESEMKKFRHYRWSPKPPSKAMENHSHREYSKPMESLPTSPIFSARRPCLWRGVSQMAW